MRLCPRCHASHPDQILVCHSDVCGEVGTPLLLRPHTVTAPIVTPTPSPRRPSPAPQGSLPGAHVAPMPPLEPTGAMDDDPRDAGINALDDDDDGDYSGDAYEGTGAPRAQGSSPAQTAALLPPSKRVAAPARPRDSRAEDALGRVLGSYKLLEVIGRGGMGRVYRAEHVRLGRQVALKLLKPEYAVKRDAVARFFQEAKAVNKIRHRNIVEVTDYVELEDGTTFIIMELLEGASLGKVLRTYGPMDPPRLLAILVQTCDALEAAHAVGIVHRDLKPDNIFLVEDEVGELAKLLDFGVAKLLAAGDGEDGEDIGWQTAAGSVVGTPAYMSPEQAGGLEVDGRSDVYSLGAIMYELFCGQPLFRGRSFGEFVVKHMSEPPVPPRQTPGGAAMSYELEEIILRCLAKKASDRYPTVGELRDRLYEQLGVLDTGRVDLRNAGGGRGSGLRPHGSSGARRAGGGPTPDPGERRASDERRGSGPGGSGGSGERRGSGSGGSGGSGERRGSGSGGSGGSGERRHSGERSAVSGAGAPSGGSWPGRPPQTVGETLPSVPGMPGLPPERQLGASFFDDGGHEGDADHPSSNGLDTRMVLGDLRAQPPPQPLRKPRATWPLWTAGAAALAIGGFVVATGVGRDPVAGAPELRSSAPTVSPLGTGRDDAATTPNGRPSRLGSRLVKLAVRTDPVGADVYVYGSSDSQCKTPCELTIDPADGGSTHKRVFTLKRDGFLDHQLEVPLGAAPPPDANVILLAENDPALTAAPARGDGKSGDGGRDGKSARDGKGTRDGKNDDARSGEPTKVATPNPTVSEPPVADPPPDVPPKTDPIPVKKPDKIDRADTLDPFGKK